MNNFSDIINANETNGTQANLTYPAEIVNVHLRPGHIIPRQVNTDAEASTIDTTQDLRTKDFTLFINRDADGNAQGKLYMDKADTISALNSHTYEDYTISLNKKQLTRFTNMDDTKNSTHQDQNLREIVILDAEDLNETNFACYYNQASSTTPLTTLKATYSTENKTLTIAPEAANTTMRMIDVMWLNFGHNGSDLNLCSQNPSGYTWENIPDITNSTAKGVLYSTLKNDTLYPNLTVEMSVLNTGAVNVRWTYQNMSSGYSKPFEVPEDIVNPMRNVTSNSTVLNKFVNVGDGQ
jgi:hypothetical protein